MAVIDRIQAVVSDKLGVVPSEVVPGANFTDDLNADSLDLVDLIMAIEEEFSTDDVTVEISDEDEIVLDRREGFNLTPKVYIKKDFKHKGQSVLYYVLNGKCDPRKPKESYWKNKVYQGYKDHRLDTKYLKEALNYFDIKLTSE